MQSAILFLWAFAESSFFPIPPDAGLITMGILNPPLSFMYALIATVGSVIGAIFGYVLGRYGGRPLVNRFFKKESVASVERYYQKYDVWAVGIAGFTPIPYKIFTLTAGCFLLDIKRFVLVSIVSRGGRFFIVATVIFFFGDMATQLIREYFALFTFAFIVLLIGGFYVFSVVARKLYKS